MKKPSRPYLKVVMRGVERKSEIRYNDKLLAEYCKHLSNVNNDFKTLLLTTIAERGVRTKSNLESRVWEIAKKKCQWPYHDRHLIAAAQGSECIIFVTESALYACRAAVQREFGVFVERVA